MKKAEQAEAHFERALALKDQGRLEESIASYHKAVALDPGMVEAHYNLGNILRAQGRLDEAAASFRRAIRAEPSLAEAHTNLGNVLQAQGNLDEAIVAYRKAVALRPGHAISHYNLGNALAQREDLEEAVASYLKAVAIAPDLAPAHCNLGSALQKQGKLDEAAALYEKVLGTWPDLAEAHSNLGLVLHCQGKLDEAATSLRRALALNPDFAGAHFNLGGTLQAQGRLEEAMDAFRKALSLEPRNAAAYHGLGLAQARQGKLDDALASYATALELKPDFVEAQIDMGNQLSDLGRTGEAVASYRKAIAMKPEHAMSYSNLLFLACYESVFDPLEYLALARGWEKAVIPEKERQAAAKRTFRHAPLAGRRLKVGYVSGDFREHAASYFRERMFAQHDRARIEVYAYSTYGLIDAVTERFRSIMEHWVPVSGLDDAAIRDRVAADGIDVLVDLSWHTAHNRMGVFARRAAPVQAVYGGLGASGLTEMDYWIGDCVVTPPETDTQFNETVWRLPRTYVSYDGRPDIPLPGPRPSDDGVLWLGSFTNLNKVKPPSLALWAKLLHALPEARLLLKHNLLSQAANRERILGAMSAHGIAADRIELQGGDATPRWSEHMAYHRRLDVSLDPIHVMSGTTTTCDALWMGVPVVTLAGDRMGSRMAASMLDSMGRPEWIARSEDEYFEKVVALARDGAQRRQLRISLRDEMARSTLCDARGLAQSFEAAYFAMYERWEQRPAPS